MAETKTEQQEEKQLLFRVPPRIHRLCKVTAAKRGMSMTDLITELIEQAAKEAKVR